MFRNVLCKRSLVRSLNQSNKVLIIPSSSSSLMKNVTGQNFLSTTNRFFSKGTKQENNNLKVEIQNVDDFEKYVFKSDVPVLVDFYADWCGPCRMLSPILEELVKEFNGKFKLVKINTDNYPGIARSFKIESLPTLHLMKGEQVISTCIGFKDINSMREFVNDGIHKSKQ